MLVNDARRPPGLEAIERESPLDRLALVRAVEDETKGAPRQPKGGRDGRFVVLPSPEPAGEAEKAALHAAEPAAPPAKGPR